MQQDSCVEMMQQERKALRTFRQVSTATQTDMQLQQLTHTQQPAVHLDKCHSCSNSSMYTNSSTITTHRPHTVTDSYLISLSADSARSYPVRTQSGPA